MPSATPNYGLSKPLASDFYDIAIANGNMDKIDAALEAVSAAQADLVPKARTINQKPLSSDIVLTPEDVGAVPATWLPTIAHTEDASRRNTVNILRLKLQQSLAADDIDAWSDLLDDSLRIDEARSLNYSVISDVRVQKIEQLDLSFSADDIIAFGDRKVAQSFSTNGAFSLRQITVKLANTGHYVADYEITMGVYTANGIFPGALLCQSTNTINVTSLAYVWNDYTFEFPSVRLNPHTRYFFSLSRSGDTYNPDVTYHIRGGPLGTSWQGSARIDDGSGWESMASYLYFTMNYGTASVVWNPVTATEPLQYAAICADQTENSGTIAWYLSDDGKNWTEVPDLDAIQEVNFQTPSVYLKCELTEDASVGDVAWGGY